MELNEKQLGLIEELQGYNKEILIKCLINIKASYPVKTLGLTTQFKSYSECINFIKKFVIGLNCVEWEYKPLSKTIVGGTHNTIQKKDTKEIDLSTLKINQTGEIILETLMNE